MAEDPSMTGKIADCVVFDETDGVGSSIPELSWSDVSSKGIEVQRFENEKILHVALLVRTKIFAMREGEDIQARPFV